MNEDVSLDRLAEELLVRARAAHSGRAAHTVYGGATHSLRQTVIALAREAELAEHESPGEATLQVLRGTVLLVSASGRIQGEAGAFMLIPPERHRLLAIDDAVVLLTVANRSAAR